MASFMDYYNEELRKQSAPNGGSFAVPDSLRSMNFNGGKAAEEPLSPLSAGKWLLDILDRPRNAVANIAKNAIDRGVAAGEAYGSGRGMEGFANTLGAIFGSVPAAVKGLVSSDHADHYTSSQLLEYGTDEIGKATDPGYIDTDHNVNPSLSGFGGFALDVATDPLMYVPGGVILKGAKAAIGLGDKVLSAGSRAVSGASRTERTLSDAAREVTETAPRALETLEAANAARAAREGKAVDDITDADIAEAMLSMGESAASKGAAAPSSSVAGAASAAGSATRASEFLGQTLRALPKGKSSVAAGDAAVAAEHAAAATAAAAADVPVALKALTALSSEGIDATARAVPRAGTASRQAAKLAEATAKPHPEIPEAVLNGGAIPQGGMQFSDLIAQSAQRPQIQQFLADLGKAREAAPAGTLNEWIAKTYTADKKIPGFSITPRQLGGRIELWNQAKRANNIVEAAKWQRELTPIMQSLMRQHKIAMEAEAAGGKSSASAFLAMKEQNATAVENALGPELFNFLGRDHSPEKFQKLIDDIGTVVNVPSESVATLSRMDKNLARDLSTALGIPRLAKPNTPEEAARWAQSVFEGSDEVSEGIGRAVQNAIEAQVTKEGYPFRLTKDGLVVDRTTLKRGEGLGKYADQFNSEFQITISRALARGSNGESFLSRVAAKTAQAIGGRVQRYGVDAARAYGEVKMRVLDGIAKHLDGLGISVVLGRGSDTVMLSQAEVYRAIVKTGADRGADDLTQLALFNRSTEVLETHLLEATKQAISGASREDVLAILLKQTKIGAKGETASGAMKNNLARQTGTAGNYLSRSAAVSAAQRQLGISRTEADKLVRRLEAGRTSSSTGKVRKQETYWINYQGGGTNHLAESLADTIMDAAPILKVRAAENAASYASRVAGETHRIATESVQRTERVLAEGDGVLGRTEELSKWKKATAEDSAKIAATPDGMMQAQGLAEAAMGKELVSRVSTLHSAAAAADKAQSPVELVLVATRITEDAWEAGKASTKAAKAAEAKVAEEAAVTGKAAADTERVVGDPPAPSEFNGKLPFDEAGQAAVKKARATGPVADLSDDVARNIDAAGNVVVDPYGLLKIKMNDWFNQTFRAKNAMPIFQRAASSMAHRHIYISQRLTYINKLASSMGAVDRSALGAAFANLQNGVRATNPSMMKLQNELREVLEDFFDLGSGYAVGSMGNSFLRISSKVDLVNATLKSKGIKHEFDVSAATVKKKFNPTALGDQWRKWEIEDPLDFLHRLNLAREELATNALTARSFIDLAKSTDAFSDVAKPGFVRMVATGESRFIGHIPEGTYIKRELADELRAVETQLRKSREFDGQLGTAIRKYYAPALNAWKRNITIMRPGHHVRNYIGSTSATWVRRGFRSFAQSHADAIKILKSRNSYRDVDMLAAAERQGFADLPKGGDVLMDLGKGRGELTVKEAYAFLAEGGAMPGFKVGEDFLETEGKFAKVMDTLTFSNTLPGRLAGGASEYTDHVTRAQHFMQALRQDARKFPNKSKQHLMESALKETQKYHPDASMLTATEAKMRLVIPFYSWFAKIMPALVESALMHPGRLTMMNKASYNLAVANGLNPDSLSNPFPEDQLFPSFISENPLGPQIKMGDSYLRLNPGMAHLDVLNTFGDDPFRGILGMTSPLLRLPVELATGGSMQTGARFSDASDYADQSIPFVNYLSNLTGYSVTGSVGSLLTGNGLDPQRGYQPKADGTTNKTDFDKGLSAFNWLTGLGAQNLSRPNYINYAEIERRNAAGQKEGN